jgi:hypothetical protein
VYVERNDEDRPKVPGFWLACGALVLGWLVLAWPWLSGRVTIPWDAKAHFQPQIQFLADALARGESPFWNPYVFSGHPQIADPQSMIFSLPFVLLSLVNPAPSLWAVDATVYGAILVGGLALVVWFRDQGWHPLGALVAALVFGFGAAMAWRIQHTGQVLSLATLPIVLLMLDRALARGSLAYGIVAGVFGGLVVLGRDQVALLSVYLLIAYVVWRLWEKPRSLNALAPPVGALGVGAIAGLLVVALPVLMTALVTGESNRPAITMIEAGKGSLHPALALTAFAPDLFGSSGRMWDYWGPPSFAWNTSGLFIAQNMGQLYIGAIPLVILLVGIFSGVLWRREIVFFTGALLAITLYALGWYTPFFSAAHAVLPGVDLYRRPADAVFLMGFLAAILVGYTVHVMQDEARRDAILGRDRRALAFTAAVCLAALIMCGLLAIHMQRVAMSLFPLGVAAAIFVAAGVTLALSVWLQPIRPWLAAGLLLAFTVGDLAYSNGPGSATALPPAHYEVLEPNSTNETIALLKRKVAEGRSDTRRDRIELVGLGFHWPNASMTHGLENTLGYNPLRLGTYSRATGAGDTVGLPEQRQFAPLFPSYRSPLADLLGLRWIASSVPLNQIDKSLQPGDLPLVAITGDGYVYENPRALPRVVFARNARGASFDKLLETGDWPDVDFRTTVVLEQVNARSLPSGSYGTARIAASSNTVVEIEAESTQGGYVVLHDLWHPWWRASVDGQPAPILKANVLFRAVALPSGRHLVRFEFAPIAGALSQLRDHK